MTECGKEDVPDDLQLSREFVLLLEEVAVFPFQRLQRIMRRSKGTRGCRLHRLISLSNHSKIATNTYRNPIQARSVPSADLIIILINRHITHTPPDETSLIQHR